MRSLLAGMAVAATFGFAAQAQATPKSFYFDCGGDTPITNLSEPPLTWSATAPTTALQDGGGCLSVDYQSFDASFGGTYAGDVMQIELNVYSVASNPAYVPDIMDVSVMVDGEPVFAEAEYQGQAAPSGSRPRDYKTTWTITDLSIPESATAKEYVISITDPYFDDFAIYGRGASDLPSGVTFSSHEDLPDPEDEEGF